MSETTVRKTKLSIVIPVYNEETFIDQVIERVQKVPFPPEIELELIAVDDCSKDATWEKLRKWESRGVRIAQHKKNGGKGAALHTGFAMATGEIVTVQDSDFEYDPQDFPALIAPILHGDADVVFGARSSLVPGGTRRVMGYWHMRINRFLTVFCNCFSDLSLSDMECCYKVFRKSFLDRIHLKENRFGFEPEVTLKISRLHPRVFEVPVDYAPRTYDEGKKITWKDGVSALRCILKYGLLHFS